MKTAALDRSIPQDPAVSVAAKAASTSTGTAVSKTAVLVGVCFLAATFTFAVGNAFIRSHFASPTANDVPIAGVLLLGCCALAVATNGAAMRAILAPYALLRSRVYFLLRLTECLTLVGVGVYFATSDAQWNTYLLAVYAISGAAGLVLSSALLTSRTVPRNLSMLGVIGYPVFLLGSALAMFNVIDITHGTGMLALVPGGLFELILPIWLFTKGFRFHPIDG
jgi:Domain of unknown function (DUF4386)